MKVQVGDILRCKRSAKTPKGEDHDLIIEGNRFIVKDIDYDNREIIISPDGGGLFSDYKMAFYNILVLFETKPVRIKRIIKQHRRSKNIFVKLFKKLF